MEARIRFASEVYLKGDTIKDIREKWENLSLFSPEALIRGRASFIEIEDCCNASDYSPINLDSITADQDDDIFY